ncbi:MAG TPA: TA system VapC family ribonuclease toxin [Tepidisphaeraceae bacterium]|nr:TA system VapC family ribonuclease toxin [Tepidisphaeraceae bacterium]
MRLLIDTNILLYAVNRKGAEYSKARAFLDAHLRSGVGWCLTWPIVYEFLRVATHPRVFSTPLTVAQAVAFIAELLQSESLTLLTPTELHFETLRQTLKEISSPAGNIFHDIATAVTLREHGVPTIVTADADFHQFRFLGVLNPLVSAEK